MALCDGPQEVSPDPTQVQDGRVDGEEALGVPEHFDTFGSTTNGKLSARPQELTCVVER